MIDKNFVKDIELYICEKFGYRNSVSAYGNIAKASTVFLTVASSW